MKTPLLSNRLQGCLSVAYWLGIIGVLLAPVGSFAGSPLKDPEALALALAKACMGRIELTGQVVGEDGRPLDGVTVDIVRSGPVPRAISWTEAPSNLTSSANVNGTFHFRLEPNCFVHLTFRKDGYFSEEKLFNIELDEDQQMAVATGTHIRLPVLAVRDIKITLLVNTGVTDLVDYGAMIECHADGSGRILDFDLRPSEGLRRVNRIDQASLLPSNSVSLRCARNPGGSFRVVTIATNALGAVYLPPSLQTVVYYLPAEVRLVMTSDRDGFRVFYPQKRKNVFRQMRIAPPTGYQRELVLNGAYFASTAESAATLEEENLFFFFRVGNRYGKGVVDHVYLDGKGSTFSNDVPRAISVGVLFRIQPDGSRNVGTDENTIPEEYLPSK